MMCEASKHTVESKKSLKIAFSHIIGSVSWPKKKELLIPPIWGCCGPTGGSIFTPGQKNHPAFFEGRWYTGKMARQKRPNGLCVLAAISEKAGWFFCPGVKIEPPVGPQQPQIGGIESSFFLANWYFQ